MCARIQIASIAVSRRYCENQIQRAIFLRMDKMDRRLLALLQEDASLSHIEIGEKVHLSASQCSRRLQRLQQEGYIAKQVALLDSEKLGLQVEAYVTVTLTSHVAGAATAFHERVRRHPSILECCGLTGDADYLLHVVTENLAAFSALINDHLLGEGHVATVRSSIVLTRIKRTTALPLPVE
jgi:Lrp/AsnC family leucine-responsive transcriptional regulator